MEHASLETNKKLAREPSKIVFFLLQVVNGKRKKISAWFAPK
jgi:hypothetical protein